MQTQLNGWQRIGIVISACWIIFICGVIAKGFLFSDFEQATSGSCPTLREVPLYSWYDDKTNKEISVYRKNETSIYCDAAQHRANELMAAYRKNDISPRIKVEYFFSIGATVIPIVAFWASAYFIVWLIKWVIIGFRR